MTEPRVTPERRIEELGRAALVIPAPADGLSGMLPDAGEVHSVASGWRLALREFASNRLAVVALVVLVAIVLFCFVGPVFYHSNQTVSNPLNASLAPGQTGLVGGGSHLLGTDELGLDEFGRIMAGGQTALEIGFFSAAVAIVIGTLYGAISGLVGGFLDAALMRFVDVLLSIPFLLIVSVLATKYGGTVLDISLVLGIWSWLIPARLVRGEVLTLRERDFVVAAQTMGSSRLRLIFRHLIPNAMSVTIVNVTFLIADSIIYLALLGFLGFNLQFPTTSWGDMLGNAQQYVQNGEWWLVYPVGGFLVVVVLCCNLIGDALRDAVDVRLRRR
ncbi:MAG TPA: ABC transporter permease [Solirubrobacteraceae bacterium]|nr:ABC transporter permease [Solirubrobacteraceae bacterium]